DKVKALHNISVNIPSRQITAIIGSSGCGKTTLLKTFNRLIDLQEGIKYSGKVIIDKENALSKNCDLIKLRKKLGMILQKPQVLPASIFGNICYGPGIHRLPSRFDPELAHKCLQEANLWLEVKDRLNNPAIGLSIGQQQRLCLARALSVEPEAILADEPTSALDPISEEHIEKLLLKLKNKYTIVIVTHNLRQAKLMADYVIFMYLGKMIEHGPAQKVFKHPQHHLTKAYLSGKFIHKNGK
ncbi:MAG: phosphate ABC transporter ATP-binding protein, partial [Candidatus Margulisbacteria bacterium]|nr:phosphate ABC transporter ATP-binding protein [Candidatus Margulisiibacteriota bacterium]